MSQYKGLTAKQAAEGLMKGIDIFLNENGYSLKYPLKETKMLMIIEQAIESAIETELASARIAAEQAQRDAKRLDWLEAQTGPSLGQLHLSQCGPTMGRSYFNKDIRRTIDEAMTFTLALPSAIRGGEKEGGSP